MRTVESAMGLYGDDSVHLFCRACPDDFAANCVEIPRAKNDFQHVAVLGNTFGDSDERVRWRTNVVLDYAHMLQSVAEKFTCEKFLTSEDDVAHLVQVPAETKPPFSPYNGSNKRACSEHESRETPYSHNGALAFLHDCTMLSQLAFYLLGNANLQPLDYLVTNFYHDMSNDMQMHHCTYVEHLGLESTFVENSASL